MNILTSVFQNIKDYILILPLAVISLTVHEFCHGYVAYKLGDSTAKQEGRLTFNPIKHIDPIGLLMMVFFRIGYAKPVPVNPLNFKSPKKGMMLTALVGPLSNVALAVVSVFAAVAFSYGTGPVFDFFIETFILMSFLNFGYAVFNLIPIHPLDGSRILGYFMPHRFNDFFIRYGSYIQIIFLVLVVFTDIVSKAVFAVQLYLYNITANFVLFVFSLFA